jgi:AraC-like DNA-binding protein
MAGSAKWTYRELRPAGLAAHVDLLWYFEGPTVCRHKRILPNGKIELLVNMAEPYRLVDGRDERIADVCVTGLQPGPLVVEQPSWQRVMGLRLWPAGALGVLGAPMSAIVGRVVGLEALLGDAARELGSRCREAAGPAECFDLARAWVETRLSRPRCATPEVVWAARHIDGAGGIVSTEELRQETGFSKTRWATAFRAEIGLGPKRYARVVRFGRLLEGLLLRGEGRLAEAAAEAGYYDQPHMTAEFRRLAGITPLELLARVHRVSGGSTAAELRPS